MAKKKEVKKKAKKELQPMKNIVRGTGLEADSELVQAAFDAVDNVFGDTSVSQEDTIERLKDIRDEIDQKIECIESDMEEGGSDA